MFKVTCPKSLSVESLFNDFPKRKNLFAIKKDFREINAKNRNTSRSLKLAKIRNI